MRSRALPILILCVAATLSAATHAATPPRWPLDLATRYLTGNFMEPRDGRFHTGLDLKTNSRTGYAVRAVADGWISRLKVAETGYGKAVYLTCPGGTTYVYAHLERLADPLRERVRDAQVRLGRYAVDLELGPDEIPVRRGAVLALSGQSGTDGPHLHFEVRGGDGQVRDPLAWGFAVPDSLPPEILAVRAVPLDAPEATLLVAGDTPLGGRLPDLVAGAGRVRFAARVVERSDALRYRLGPWRISLTMDGDEVFAARNDSQASDRNGQQRLEYAQTDLGWERWLAREPRLPLAGRSGAGWFDAGVLAPGDHALRLAAEDRAGNRSAVAWRLFVPAAPADTARWRGWPEGPAVLGDPWRMTAPTVDVVASPVGLERRCGPLDAPAPADRRRLTGLVTLGDPVQWRTRRAVLLDPVTVVLPGGALPDDPAAVFASDVAVYRLEDGAWTYAAAPRRLENGPGFPLERPGVYRLLRDTAPPVIATATVETILVAATVRRRHGIALPRWPEVRIPVGDHGSGIAWGDIAVELDGSPLVVEPDPPRDRILVELPDETAAGEHRLRVRARDRAGHERTATLVLTLMSAGVPPASRDP